MPLIHSYPTSPQYKLGKESEKRKREERQRKRAIPLVSGLHECSPPIDRVFGIDWATGREQDFTYLPRERERVKLVECTIMIPTFTWPLLAALMRGVTPSLVLAFARAGESLNMVLISSA